MTYTPHRIHPAARAELVQMQDERDAQESADRAAQADRYVDAMDTLERDLKEEKAAARYQITRQAELENWSAKRWLDAMLESGWFSREELSEEYEERSRDWEDVYRVWEPNLGDYHD